MNGILGIIQTTRLTMSEEELRGAIDMLIAERDHRRERAFKKVKRALKKGDAVSFIDNSGKRVTGEVTKVKTKKALVQVGNTNWDVPMGMLSLTR